MPKAPFTVVTKTGSRGRVYKEICCCSYRYINRRQAAQHLMRHHGYTESSAMVAIKHAAGEPLYGARPHDTVVSYVREVCTCAAKRPECPACVNWRKHFGGNPPLEERHKSHANDTPRNPSELRAAILAAQATYKVASRACNFEAMAQARLHIAALKWQLKQCESAGEKKSLRAAQK